MLTIEDAYTWGMREEAHYNGGKEFFAYSFRCSQQPRLTRVDKYARKDKSVTSTWRVDGHDVANLETAIDALNRQPTFSSEEIALLATITDEPSDRRKEMIANSGPWEALREKAAIVWERGRVRITDAGRAALKDGESHE